MLLRRRMNKGPKHRDIGGFSFWKPNRRYKDGDRLIYTRNGEKPIMITIKEL